jgi:hypothetical protein
VLVEEARGRVVIDERVVGEALNRATVSTGVAERVPRGQQLRVLLMQLGLEPAEGALALDGPTSLRPARSSPI